MYRPFGLYFGGVCHAIPSLYVIKLPMFFHILPPVTNMSFQTRFVQTLIKVTNMNDFLIIEFGNMQVHS